MLLLSLLAAALALWRDQRTSQEDRAEWRPLLAEEAIGKDENEEQKETLKAAKSEQLYRIEGMVDYIWPEEEQLRIRLKAGEPGAVLVFLKQAKGKGQEPLKIGNRLEVIGEQWEFTRNTVPGQFDEHSYYTAGGYALRIQAEEWRVTDTRIIWWRQKLWQLRQSLLMVYERLLPSEKAGVLSAMLLGEKRMLDSEIKKGYQTSGISHLLAVSGLHVSLLGGAVLYLLRKLRWPVVCPRMAADGIAILLILSYGMLLDYPVSTSRAVIMIVLSILAGMLGRTYDMPTALSCAMLLLVLQEPAAAYQAGFQLSFGAVAGIWLLYPVFDGIGGAKEKRNSEIGWKTLLSALKKGVRVSLLTSLSILFLTLPIQMYHFYEISLPGLWNNLLVLPVMPLVLLTGIAGGLFGLLPGGLGVLLGRFCLGSTCVILQFYEWICRFGKLTEWAVWVTGRPSGWQIGVYYSMLAGILFWKKRSLEKRKQKQEQGEAASLLEKGTVPFFLSVALVVLLFRFPVTRVTFLDVGQGDGMVVQSAAGSTFLVDGGSSNVSGVGKWRLLPFLKQEGVRQIDGVLLTHMDGDHISGILELLEEGEVPIKALWLPAVYQEQEALQEDRYQALLAAAKKSRTQVGYLKPGDRLQDKKVVFCCLGPNPDRICPDQNSASLALTLLIGDTSLLLTGDMGEKEEHLLIEAQEKLAESSKKETEGIRQKIDILKVGHHGSKHSGSQEFLQWCGAKVAVISASLKNRYGHPHPETLQRLSAAGCQTFCTAWNGSIQIRWRRDGSMELWHYQ